jgi:hypothetical protein
MKKLIFIGIDGMDPLIVESLMERGELPNFSRLRDEGCYSRLETLNLNLLIAHIGCTRLRHFLRIWNNGLNVGEFEKC